MTVPKKQSTAAKKARAAQAAGGGKYTALLAGQVCGQDLDPFGEYWGIAEISPEAANS